jgi:uncharacterized protein YaaQ
VRLVLAIVQSADAEPLLRDFSELAVLATQIEGDAAVGQGGRAAVMVGVADDQLEDVLTLILARARGQVRPVEPLRPVAERAEFWIPGPTERSTGGASVYVLPIQRFERIEYA